MIYPKYKDNGLFLISYAKYLNDIESYSAALCILEEAKMNYTDPSLYTLLALMYEENGHLQKADFQFKQTLKIFHNYPDITCEYIHSLIE